MFYIIKHWRSKWSRKASQDDAFDLFTAMSSRIVAKARGELDNSGGVQEGRERLRNKLHWGTR